MNIIAKFEAEHPTCAAWEVPNNFSWGMHINSFLFFVPPPNWDIKTYSSHQEKKFNVSLSPSNPLEHGWPLLSVDVYVVVSDNIEANLRHAALDNSPSSEYKYKDVGPTLCVHLGSATLSTLLGDPDTTRHLHCKYKLDLSFGGEQIYNEIDFYVLQKKKQPRISINQQRALDLQQRALDLAVKD